MKAKFVLCLVFLFLFLTGCDQERVKCIKDDGNWKTFDDYGADICGREIGGGDVMTASCDCGPNRCWNGTKCMSDVR